MVNGGAKAPLLTKEGRQPLRLAGWFSFSKIASFTATPKRKRKGRKGTGLGIPDSKFEIQNSKLRATRSVHPWRPSSFANFASPLRSLRLLISVENAKFAKRNPAKAAKVCISNFKFKSEILDRLPIRAFLADPKFLRLAAGVVPVRDA